MVKESKAQRDTIGRVMDEFKHGKLQTGGGGKVRDRKQAIAIALSEAGASNQQSPSENRRKLADTKRKERTRQTVTSGPDTSLTRAALYAAATRQGVTGRSRMTKADLRKALDPAGAPFADQMLLVTRR